MIFNKGSLAGLMALIGFLFIPTLTRAGIEGTLAGMVLGVDAKPLPEATVHLLSSSGQPLKTVITDAEGSFGFYSVVFGDYQVSADAQGATSGPFSVHLSSGDIQRLTLTLSVKPMEAEADSYTVAARRNLISRATSSSRNEVSRQQIDRLPQGASVSLPKLLTSTNPGMVLGSFGQVFTRGNHANLQFQVDGVQLPDSVSGAFGEAFSPRNIERMEVITGGIPAEYGNRLAGVLNIVTRSGDEAVGGLDIAYGSFNRLAPQMTYGGASPSGNSRYFLSASAFQTDRGLDTPQPASEDDPSHGGQEVVHDHSQGDNEFFKWDQQWGPKDKLTLALFNSHRTFEIPNYPGSFKPSDPYFTGTNADGSDFSDAFGNGAFDYRPSGTNDNQSEQEDYVQLLWREQLSDRSFFQLAPYWKYSAISFHGDRSNDLASITLIPGSAPTSFSEDRRANNVGLKGDYSVQSERGDAYKAGFQVFGSQASGSVSIITADPANPPATLESDDDSVDRGYQEGAYVQTDYHLAPQLVANIGLRFDATQFQFSDSSSSDSALQPRLGLSYLPTDSTKVHLFYGRLFMPAPVENLRKAFSDVAGAALAAYDIKAEKDNFSEVGIDQQVGGQLLSLNAYYKDATDMLDEAQLLNTAISQPFNLASGFAYGVEFSLKGSLGWHISDFLNYSYEIAMGQGLSGGIFAFDPTALPAHDYQYLDHVQVHTANAGLAWENGGFSCSAEGLYGSGLRTGDANSQSLPAHLTMDASLGYALGAETWARGLRMSVDALNIMDNAYAITVANGFNGSHYAAGREFLVRLSKSL